MDWIVLIGVEEMNSNDQSNNRDRNQYNNQGNNQGNRSGRTPYNPSNKQGNRRGNNPHNPGNNQGTNRGNRPYNPGNNQDSNRGNRPYNPGNSQDSNRERRPYNPRENRGANRGNTQTKQRGKSAYNPNNKQAYNPGNRPYNPGDDQVKYGADQENNQGYRPGMAAYESIYERMQNQSEADEAISKKRKRIVIGIISVIVLIIAFYFIYNNFLKGPEVINMKDYFKMNFSGYDGFGNAELVFDAEGFAEDYQDKLEVEEENDLEVDNENLLIYLADEMVKSASFEGNGELTNGDVVQVTWEIPEEEIEAVTNVDLKLEPAEYEVEGLLPVTMFDPFEDFSITFEGVEPQGQVTSLEKPEVASNFEYIVEPGSGLKNGDEVEVSIDFTRSMLEETGMYPEEFTNTYVVEGLARAPEGVDSFTEDQLSSIDEEALDIIAPDVVTVQQDGNTYNATIEYTSPEVIGHLLLTRKGDQALENPADNIFYVVMQSDYSLSHVNQGQTYTDEGTVFFYVAFTGIVRDPSGELDYIEAHREPQFNTTVIAQREGSENPEEVQEVSMKGFSTCQQFINAQIIDNSVNYNIDTDISDEELDALSQIGITE